MARKHIQFLIVCLLLICKPMFAQFYLQKDKNMLRCDDALIKQQVKYKHPGRSGENVLWDFSKQELVDKKYSVTYSKADDCIRGCEHKTIYDYNMKGDSLFLKGYENPTTSMIYYKPELLLTFPFVYKNKIESYFYGIGDYCKQLKIDIQGQTITQADAYGMIIMPDGDTLRNVLRVHSVKKFTERMKPYSSSGALNRTYIPKDSIEYHLNNDSVFIQLDTYKWYSDSYRYPIFETVESRFLRKNKPTTHFNTSFFYSPETHSYLETDSVNLARIKELEEKKSKRQDNTIQNEPKIIHYNAFIEPNSNKISIEYDLTEAAQIEIIIADMQGRILTIYPKKKHAEGYYKEAFAIDGYRIDAYMIRIGVNEKVYGISVVK